MELGATDNTGGSPEELDTDTANEPPTSAEPGADESKLTL